MKLYQILVLLLFTNALVAIDLPTNLDTSDRKAIAEILAGSTSFKISSDVYPLGGYQGFDFGINLTSIPTKEFSELGNGDGEADNNVYPSFYFGKGLYRGLDLFGMISPYNPSTVSSQYAGAIRYKIYEMTELPIYISVQLYIDNLMIENKMLLESQGLDIFLGMHFTNDLALSLSMGRMNSEAEFLGGSSGITDSGNTETEKTGQMLYSLAISKYWNQYYLNTFAKYYDHISYGLTIGIRY